MTSRVARVVSEGGLDVAHLRFSEELLELLLRQQPVVLHKCWHLWGALCLIVNCPVNLHVAIQNGKKLFFIL